MASLSSVLAPLAALNNARKSIPEYYVPLTSDGDEVVRVAAWSTMCGRKMLPYPLYESCIEYARHGAIKVKAFDYFESIWEHGLAAKVAAADVEPETNAEFALAEAQLRCDDLAAARACSSLYLATGAFDALVSELDFHYKAAGPLAALPLAVRNLVLSPHEPTCAFRLLQLCLDVARADLIEEIVSLLTANDLHPRISAVYSACASHLRGNAAEALGKLAQVGRTRPTSAAMTAQLGKTAQRLRAEILEKQGDYRDAYAAYQELNRVTGGKEPDSASFRKRMISVAKIDVPVLPAEDRSGWFMMVGFPRSGTTLLENALAAHPAIETFEELPTRATMQLYLDRKLPRCKSPEERVAVFVEARARYYDEMERRRRKTSASIFIDKSPIRSADAGFVVKAFPELRGIFSIRHPFDVVLSCFKQAFAPNMAMENFRTFENTVAFYDFTMSTWFAAYGREDPRIHYLKYDDLVTEFEPRMRAAIAFLGADWDDAVLDFATAAQNRASLTPSYQKVRQGLSIGVQTSWRNYGFLFKEPAAKPLYKWAEFLGYPTK